MKAEKMRNPDRRVAISSGALLALAVLAACVLARSEESIRSEFDAYVSGANQCTDVSQCTFAFASCPLDCFVAVRADRKEDVESKAKDLVSEYERGGRGCSASCRSPTGVICLAGRCTEGDAQPGGPGGASGSGGIGNAGSGGSMVSGGGGTSGDSGGGPIATASVSFMPADGTTAAQGMDLAVSIYDPAGVVRPADLEILRSSIVLATWPARQPVPATVTVAGGGGAAGMRVLVTPQTSLGDQWYALLLPSIGSPFVAASHLPDGTAGMRFRPTPQPRVRAIDVCLKEAPGSKLLILFSEPVTYVAPTAGLVSLTIDGAASPCDVYDAQAGGLYLTCAALQPTSRATVSVGAGIQGASQLALAPATFAVDVAALPAGSCRELLTPIP